MTTPLILAVMGPTGVGKSTFIEKIGGTACATERRGQKPIVGHGQEACTSMPELYQIGTSEIYLLDTPGFDDTYLSDREILLRISKSLKEFSESCRVTGIIYVHQIIDARMKGSARKNLIMFKKLIGNNNMNNCCLVTTKWGQIESSTGVAREEELRTNENFWQPMIANGASVARFYDTEQSARAIITPLLGNGTFVPTVITEWQRCNELHKTSAGMEVEDRVGQMREAHEANLEDVKEDKERALREKDYETARELEKERKKIQEELDRIQEERDLLKEKHTAAEEKNAFYVEQDRKRSIKLGQKAARKERWGKRLVTVGIGGLVTVATGGLAAPLAMAAYAAVEVDCQEERKRMGA